MSTTYRIVVGVDGSEGGTRALRWAVREAATRGATVEAVTAFTYDALDTSDIGSPQAQRAVVEQMLGNAVATALNDNPRVTLTTRVIFDDAPAALTDTARDAELLVLGSHGHGRLFHAVLGSVAEQCVRRATCPVVVVPAARTEPTSAEPTQTKPTHTEPTGLPAAIL